MMCSIDLFFVYLSRVARGESKMADCSPDSSTQQRPPKKRRKHDPMRYACSKEKYHILCIFVGSVRFYNSFCDIKSKERTVFAVVVMCTPKIFLPRSSRTLGTRWV